MFRQLDGREPDRNMRAKLAQELGLSETQVYKWFFDTKKKVEQDELYALEIGQDVNLVRNANGSQTVR
jgi:hypothetical protein